MRTLALILAAGFSSRMEGFKPLLPLPAGQGECTALELLCRTSAECGIPALVVSGFRGEEVDAAAQACGVRSVRNATPEKGMFSSIVTGLAAVPEEVEAVLVQPVDVPLVRPLTLQRLLAAAHENSGNAVLIPTYDGKEGHPPLIPRAYVDYLVRWQGQGGLREALQGVPRRSVPVADALCLPDMDTRTDYAAMRQAAARRQKLTPQEAEWMLDIEGLPPRGQRHCRAVGAVAAVLARALNKRRHEVGAPLERFTFEKGENARRQHSAAQTEIALIDEEEALVGGLLHDICKGQPRHEAAAGRLLRHYGLERAAWLVESHRDMEIPDTRPLTARELVFLADKVVCGAWALPLEQRFQQKLDQFCDDAEACAAIRGRRDRAARLAARFAAEAQADILELALTVVPSWEDRERTGA